MAAESVLDIDYKSIPGYPQWFRVFCPLGHHRCTDICDLLYNGPCNFDLEVRAVFGERLTRAELNSVICSILRPMRPAPSWIAMVDSMIRQKPELKHACDVKRSIKEISASYSAKEDLSPAEIAQFCFAIINGVIHIARPRSTWELFGHCRSLPMTPTKKKPFQRRRTKSEPENGWLFSDS
jgi:hypothetical protein